MLLSSLLWRLPVLGVDLSGAGAKMYKFICNVFFERDSFLASLTEAEREMRLPSKVMTYGDYGYVRVVRIYYAHYDWIIENDLTPHLVVDEYRWCPSPNGICARWSNCTKYFISCSR